MAKQFPNIDDTQRRFIEAQKIFFTASATDTSRVNLSPRPTDTFRVVNPNTVLYLDNTGSGNETAAHLQINNRLTIMMCSFEKVPQILRLYGQAQVINRQSPEFNEIVKQHFNGNTPTGARQVIMQTVDLVQTSCGFGVPFFDYVGERDTLTKWANKKGEDGIKAYWKEKNQTSMDGLPTGLPVED